MLKKSSIIFLIILTILFFIEIISGRFLFGKKIDCIYLKCGLQYNTNINFIKENKNKKIYYSKDSKGFRGVRKNYSNIDFLVVGGSTTEEKFLDDNDTWTEKLEKRFIKENYDVEIVNAGVDGQSTLGHLSNFEKWFPYVENLEPKFIVFYVGLNEYRSESFLRYDNFRKDKSLLDKIKKLIIENNGIIINLLRKIKQKRYLSKDKFNEIYVHSPNIDRKYILKKLNLDLSYNNDFNIWLDKDFITRLVLLTDYTYKMKAKPIFISQKSNRWFFKNEDLYEAFNQNIKQDENHQSYFLKEKKIDETMKKFAKENNLNFISGFKKFNFKDEFFYDYLHTNIKGSDYISEVLYPFFKRIYINNI